MRTGIELLTERGYMIADIDSVLKKSGVPKGSFDYYFKNKEEFRQAVIEGYADYFNRKLDKFLDDKSLSPLERIRAFYENAKVGMTKFDFTRGCLVGNVAKEATILFTAKL
ncbi:TetR/AcrR family transcriptional regulator [Rodentibacter rarus]|uniref:TetR/AcrR family transcriptional regulator n=1 Tax=Rodentibacter rarus TaxID=1908260 RepID=UPI00244C80E9|nr:TetR/AcrR family transcriptional regulator [Rodentibacter rarus]